MINISIAAFVRRVIEIYMKKESKQGRDNREKVERRE